MKLLIFEGSWKEATLKQLMNSWKVPKCDFAYTLGHIYELKWKKDWKKESIAVSMENLRPTYWVMSDKKELVSKLRSKIEKADEVIVFTDNDFEGEVIAYSLYKEFKEYAHKMKRGYYTEISEKWINQWLENATADFNFSLADAWMARAVLDRIIGWTYSPIVYLQWNGITNVSAGRCQSPTLRFLAEREREIINFSTRNYYTVNAKHDSFTSHHVKNKTLDENENLVFSEENAEILKNKLSTVSEWKIESYEESSFQTNPKEPFNGTTFQEACSNVLWLGVDEITEIWQSLYEKWLLTYIRTDAIVLESEKNEEIRNLIKNKLGWDFLPRDVVKYKNPDSAQEWHCWISPVDVNLLPKNTPDTLTPNEKLVYELVWRRTIASQMPPAIYDKQSIIINIVDELFSYSNAKNSSLWFLKVWNYNVEEEDSESDWDSKWIDNISESSIINVKWINTTAHKTKPKSRYKLASCIKQMDKIRAGRPATFKNILKSLEKREYIITKGKQQVITVTEKWLQAVDIIMWFAWNDIMDYKFTEKMENDRDALSKWKLTYDNFVKSFYANIKYTMDKYKIYIDDNWFVRSWNSNQNWQAPVVKTGHECPLCKSELIKKQTSKWEIISCSASKYEWWKNSGCKYFNFIWDAERTWEECPLCKGELIIITTKTGLKLKKCEYSTYDSVEKKNIGCWFKAIKV